MTDGEVQSLEGYRNLYIFCNIHFTPIIPLHLHLHLHLHLSITNPERYDLLNFFIPHSLAATCFTFLFTTKTMAVVGVPLPVLSDLSKQESHIVVGEIEDVFPSFDRSVEDLTLEEKLGILSGLNFTQTNGVPRLGIPALKVRALCTCIVSFTNSKIKIVDTVTGVKGSEHFETPTLCFPSATCMGATWNSELLSKIGGKLALQAKSKSAQVLLGPVLNLHRDPRGGRNFESFSEDPLLAGELAAAMVNAIQAGGVAVCPKHFVGNESETKRRFHDVAESLDGRPMREIYLAAWQVLLRKSNPAAIMAA